MNKSTIIALALGTALGATPALAATTTNAPNAAPSHQATATVNPGQGSQAATSPSQRNPLLADNGDVRIGKLIGTDVYNSQDKQIGTVDGVLMGQSGTPTVIISSNGKLVQVPWNKLTFGNAKLNGDNKVIIANETQQALNGMPEFHYTGNE